MREPAMVTVSDVLYWGYANLAMAEHAVHHASAEYSKLDYIIRNRLWSGLRKGTMQPGSPVKDLRSKVRHAGRCAYCGSADHVSMDHLVGRARGGRESADNIIFACRSCNSSKGDRDVLEWFARRGQFPPLFVLRVYLKEAIAYCRAHGLMDRPKDEAGDIPFALAAIPLRFPLPRELAYHRALRSDGTKPAPDAGDA